MVITARPEFRPAWLAEPGVERIELEPLGAAESAEMVERVSGRAAPLPPAVIGEILRRADGVPLFLEELTRAVLEGRAAAGLREPAPAAVPSSIHASLLARLDRLGAARNLAEVAAAIGREFGLDLLGRVAGLRPEELEVPMARLLASGLVHPAGPSGGRSYRFKHALICDAAYGTILRTRRRELHARIAEALEAAASQDGPARPQLLAHHYTEAGLAAPAARWWLAAGLQSLQQSAMTEALAQLRRGLTLAAELPEAEPRLRLELELWIACTKALFVTAGWAAEATGEAFAHARALCDRLGTPPQLRTVLFGQWLRALVRGEPQAALAQAEDVLARGIALGDPEWRLLGHYCVGMTQLPLGGFALVKQHLGAGIALFDPAKREAYAGPVVGDPRVIMRTYRAWAMLCTGAYAEAWAESATALAEAREAGQALALAHALWHRAYQTVAVEGVPEALAALQPLWPVVNEHGLAFYQGLGGILQGWCLGRLGDPRGLTALRAGLEGYRRTGSRNHLSSFLRMEAEVLGATGAAAEGLDRAEAAGRLMRETGEGWDAAEIARVRGTLLHQLGETASAEAALREARARAAAQGAVWFGLRAAVSLARLLAETGRREAAREVLAPEAEAEGPCMDLREARALLAELGG
ncbi:MAG TPA: hypothetical protein VE684_16990, partial [Crenalkalicoccus sp.]|nr:hypothetical protein [Crenalkalicoccus sp.]